MSESAVIESVCVYCGSRVGARAIYRETAAALGRAVATAGIRLVYGGARVGLMGAMADAARDAGGSVLGVIPRQLTERELAHDGLTELQIVASMHERKLVMSEAADAFIAMPGGFGTLEEFFEAVTWHQLGHHDKPCGLLDAEGFYAPLLECLQHMAREGFVSRGQVERIRIHSDPTSLLENLGIAGAAAATPY